MKRRLGVGHACACSTSVGPYLRRAGHGFGCSSRSCVHVSPAGAASQMARDCGALSCPVPGLDVLCSTAGTGRGHAALILIRCWRVTSHRLVPVLHHTGVGPVPAGRVQERCRCVVPSGFCASSNIRFHFCLGARTGLMELKPRSSWSLTLDQAQGMLCPQCMVVWGGPA